MVNSKFPVLFALIMGLSGCGATPRTYLTSSMVLTGSTSPNHTINSTGRASGPLRLLEIAGGVLFGTLGFASDGVGRPLAVHATFYRFFMSTRDDCSSATLIHDYGELGSEKDLTFDPVLFYGAPAETKYKCLVLELDDTVIFRPDRTAVLSFPTVCTHTSMEYSSDLYRSDGTFSWTTPSGTAIPARGTQLVPVTDRVFLFASTSPTRVVNGPVKAQASQVSLLPTVVETPSSLVFYADFENRVSASGSVCHLESPTLGFR